MRIKSDVIDCKKSVLEWLHKKATKFSEAGRAAETYRECGLIDYKKATELIQFSVEKEKYYRDAIHAYGKLEHRMNGRPSEDMPDMFKHLYEFTEADRDLLEAVVDEFIKEHDFH